MMFLLEKIYPLPRGKNVTWRFTCLVLSFLFEQFFSLPNLQGLSFFFFIVIAMIFANKCLVKGVGACSAGLI